MSVFPSCFLFGMMVMMPQSQVHAGDCSEPPYLENGYFTQEYEGGASKVSYTCREGYTLEGNAENFCLDSDGSSPYWAFALPECEASTSCPAVVAADMPHVRDVDVRSGDGVSYHSTLKVTCDGGYVLQPHSDLYTCTTQGTWQPPIPQCVVPMCLIPTTANLIVTIEDFYEKSADGTRVESGAEADFSCGAGYKLEGGPSRAMCLSSAQWDANIPTCRQIRCTVPRSGNGLSVDIGAATETNNQVPQGTIIHFSCVPSDKYELIGATSATCQQSETWSAPAAYCREIRCTVPRSGNGLSVDIGDATETNNQVPIGTIIHFSCVPSDKYELIGATSATCQQSETWSKDRPECTEHTHPWRWDLIIGLTVGGVVLVVVVVVLVLKFKASKASATL